MVNAETPTVRLYVRERGGKSNFYPAPRDPDLAACYWLQYEKDGKLVTGSDLTSAFKQFFDQYRVGHRKAKRGTQRQINRHARRGEAQSAWRRAVNVVIQNHGMVAEVGRVVRCSPDQMPVFGNEMPTILPRGA